LTIESPELIVDCEGAIEEVSKIVYKAMIDEKKKKVNFKLLITSDWMHVQFLNYMIDYLQKKKARKVDHVNLDIYIETKEEDDEED
jgi:hypothetical protein